MRRAKRGRVIRLRAEKDGRVVKVTASIQQATYHSRNSQNCYQRDLANELHAALRAHGFDCQDIRFEKQ